MHNPFVPRIFQENRKSLSPAEKKATRESILIFVKYMLFGVAAGGVVVLVARALLF